MKKIILVLSFLTLCLGSLLTQAQDLQVPAGTVIRTANCVITDDRFSFNDVVERARALAFDENDPDSIFFRRPIYLSADYSWDLQIACLAGAAGARARCWPVNTFAVLLPKPPWWCAQSGRVRAIASAARPELFRPTLPVKRDGAVSSAHRLGVSSGRRRHVALRPYGLCLGSIHSRYGVGRHVGQQFVVPTVALDGTCRSL